ncbi:MAG: FAD-binding oxidoreductase [Burkholderiaceae bacterium]
MHAITLSNGTRFDAEPGASILDAATARGVVLEHGCRTGRCGSCKARVAGGSTRPLRDPAALSDDERRGGWILTCTDEAASDLHLDIEDLGALAGVEARVTPARIDGLERLAPDVMRVGLRLPPRSPFRFLPGQHLDVTSPAGVRRSYSIASGAAAPDKVELQIRRVDGGRLSAYWFEQAKAGDLLRFNGPRGTFFLRPVAGLDVVFLATGTGIAPIRSMLLQLAALGPDEAPRSVSLYWGGRRREDLYLDPVDALPGLRHVPVLSRGDAGWRGAKGHVQDALLHEVAHGAAPALAGAAVYACGSEAMIHGARRLLADAGLPARRFHFDAFVSSD